MVGVRSFRLGRLGAVVALVGGGLVGVGLVGAAPATAATVGCGGTAAADLVAAVDAANTAAGARHDHTHCRAAPTP